MVRGTVREDATGAPIAGAAIRALDAGGRGVAELFSDERGRFILRLPAAASYRLSASRLGYAPTTTDSFFVGLGEERSIDISVAVEPVWLNSIRVAAESRVPHLQSKGFYRRLELGFGHFMIKDQIERRSPGRMTDLFYGLPGVRVIDDSVEVRGCLPTLVLDGVVLSDRNVNQVVTPYDVEGVEVFASPAGVPPEYWRGPCGTILIWTRR